MSGSLAGLIELLLIFGVVIGWAAWQWLDWRRWKRSRREGDDDPQRREDGAGGER